MLFDAIPYAIAAVVLIGGFLLLHLSNRSALDEGLTNLREDIAGDFKRYVSLVAAHKKQLDAIDSRLASLSHRLLSNDGDGEPRRPRPEQEMAAAPSDPIAHVLEACQAAYLNKAEIEVFQSKWQAQAVRRDSVGSPSFVLDDTVPFAEATHWLVPTGNGGALLFPGQILRARVHQLAAGDGSALSELIYGIFEVTIVNVQNVLVLEPARARLGRDRLRWEVYHRGRVQLMES